MTNKPTKAEADRDVWLDGITREATSNIAWLVGCSGDTATNLYGHLVKAEADAIQRAAEDEDYRFWWDQAELLRRQRRGGVTQ